MNEEEESAASARRDVAAASDPRQLAERLAGGDRRALARSITLVESSRPEDRKSAEALLDEVAGRPSSSLRVAVSGAPGAGKSTFIEALGRHLIAQNRRPAVLTVDPSSSLSGGSILGDKTRMPELARHPAAFVRPSPTRGRYGGVARRTPEAIMLCEAAGFDPIVIETVGVGQSEAAVVSMVDMLVLLVLPGGGDELQGIKRGIMELADLVLINKADGALTESAAATASEYASAAGLLAGRWRGWRLPVRTCSALTGHGIAMAWTDMQRFRASLDAEIRVNREEQALRWLWSEVEAGFRDAVEENPELRQARARLEEAVRGGEVAAPIAALRLLRRILDG